MSSSGISDGSVTERSLGLPSIILPMHEVAEVSSVFLSAESCIVNRKLMISSISEERSKHQDDEIPSLSRVTTSARPGILMRSSISDEKDSSSRTKKQEKKVPGIVLAFLATSDPDPKVCLDDAWGMLKPAIGIVFNDEPPSIEYTEIFNTVQKAWMAKSGEDLYKLILEECGTHVSAALQSLEEHCNDGDPSVFLPLIEKCWLDFNRRMRFLCSFAGCEGRRPDGRTLWDFGLELFRKHLCLAPSVLEKVLSSIILLVTDQRLGKPVDMSQLKTLMDMFNGAPFFHSLSIFQERFVQCAADFYAVEALQVLHQCDFPQYLKHVDQRLREEKEKCNRLYLFCKFEKKLIPVVQEKLLGVHASSILEKGFAKLMDESCQEDLQRLYNLFSEADLLGHLNHALSSYILETGRNILRQGSSLARFKASVDKICHSYFLENKSLEKIVECCFMHLGFFLSCKLPESIEEE